jgi:hypothetical protein
VTKKNRAIIGYNAIEKIAGASMRIRLGISPVSTPVINAPKTNKPTIIAASIHSPRGKNPNDLEINNTPP